MPTSWPESIPRNSAATSLMLTLHTQEPQVGPPHPPEHHIRVHHDDPVELREDPVVEGRGVEEVVAELGRVLQGPGRAGGQQGEERLGARVRGGQGDGLGLAGPVQRCAPY